MAASPAHAQDEEAAARRAAIQSFYPMMIAAVEAGNFTQARNLCEQAILWEPANPVHRYNLACIESRVGGAFLPRALEALEQAVQLGFNDANALRSDPDLAAIRGHPKFVELLQRLTASAPPALSPAQGNPAPAPVPPAGPAPKAATTNRAPAEKPVARPAAIAKGVAAPSAKAPPGQSAAGKVDLPAPATFQNGVPVGLYFMTRYWSFTRTLEKASWYFAPDGTAYAELEHGFSAADLAAHAGRKGTGRMDGAQLEITWADGTKTKSTVEPSRSGRAFTWDMGIFTVVQPFGDPAEVAGAYEGGESLSVGGSSAVVSKRLELRPDGTFAWSGVSFIGNTTESSRVSAGAVDAGSTGTWRIAGYSLILADTQGNVFRRIAFPYDDESTPLKPDRIFFGGMMYKKQR